MAGFQKNVSGFDLVDQVEHNNFDRIQIAVVAAGACGDSVVVKVIKVEASLDLSMDYLRMVEQGVETEVLVAASLTQVSIVKA